MKKIVIINLCIILFGSNLFGQQTYVNQEWVNTVGTTNPIFRTASALDQSGNLIVVSSTISGINNSDILITKQNSEGNILWQKSFDGSAQSNDYAVQLKINSSNEIFVAATLTENNATGLDFGLLKYSGNGDLEWVKYWNGTAGEDDVPTDLSIDEEGNIYLVGGSESTTENSSFAVIKFDEEGNFKWYTDYDFAELHNVAIGSVFNEENLIVTGISASSPQTWDFATLEINIANGNILNEERVPMNGVGIGDVTGVATDLNNNIYITGSIGAPGTRNIQTVKLDPSIGLKWIKNFDSGFEDISSAIKVDKLGNIIVVGTKENGNGGKDYVTIKYNTNGTVIWSKEFGSEGASYNATAADVAILQNGGVIVTGSIVKNGVKQIATIKYSPAGELKFVQNFDAGLNWNEAKSVKLDGKDIYVTGVSLINNEYENVTVKYRVFKRVLNVASDEEGGEWSENELIIKFSEEVLNNSVIDNREFIAGKLSDFINSEAIEQMNEATGMEWNQARTYKMYRNMTPEDKFSTTRLGEIVELDAFWATLIVQLPLHSGESTTEESVSQDLNEIYPTIDYSERNFYGTLLVAPNDALYTNDQTALHDPGHGANIEDAWDIEVGETNIRVGIFDSGVNWRHEDFGDGTSTGTKVVEGHDFQNVISQFQQTNPDWEGHGTAVAGIIGALRNNGIGIAGIAGGDMQNANPNTGANLVSMRITKDCNTIFSFSNRCDKILISEAAPAIVEGAANSPNFGYALDIQNHSWGTSYQSAALKSAVKSAFLNHSLLVAASGNAAASGAICTSHSCVLYPASYNDEWVVKVGATDNTGTLASFSVHSNNVDVVAPGTDDINTSLDHDDNIGYSAFGVSGTSFAAPIVSGISALLMSEHNVANGYPNNLAPEDVERFLQSFATDINAAGYDNFTGSGRVNGSSTLWHLTLPRFFVSHQGGQGSPQQNKVASSQYITLTDNIAGVAAGTYIADRYEVTNTFVHVYNTNQRVIGEWPRYSSSLGLSASSIITNDTYFQLNSAINNNVAQITTKTNAWHIVSTIVGQALNKWVPAHPSALKTSYSLYIEDGTVGLEEQEVINNMSVYPNPAKTEFIVEFNLEQQKNAQLTIFSATGKTVVDHDLGLQSEGQNKVTINLSNLSNGLYLVHLKVGDEIVNKRIVKN